MSTVKMSMGDIMTSLIPIFDGLSLSIVRLADVLRQTACLVVILSKVNRNSYFFNCTTAGRASDCITVPP